MKVSEYTLNLQGNNRLAKKRKVGTLAPNEKLVICYKKNQQAIKRSALENTWIIRTLNYLYSKAFVLYFTALETFYIIYK